MARRALGVRAVDLVTTQPSEQGLGDALRRPFRHGGEPDPRPEASIGSSTNSATESASAVFISSSS
jgi:hypothetical protein